MTNDSTPHEGFSELLVPYALRQLEPAERARLERALETDADLRAELEAIERTGATLLGELPRRSAPPNIKAAVMASVEASAAAAAEAEAARTAPTPAPVPAPVGDLDERRRRRWSSAPILATGLAVACAALAFVALDLRDQLDTATTRADRLERAADAQAQGGPPAGFVNASTHTVPTTENFGDATGSLIQVSKDKWILAFNDVPEPAKGRSWQVWTADSKGEIRNVAQWHQGDTQLLVLDSDDITEVMVSYEPTTEPAPAPTGAPVADVKV